MGSRPTAGVHPPRHFRLSEIFLLHCGFDLSGENLLDGGRCDSLVDALLAEPAIVACQTGTRYAEYMSQLQARVENGRLVLDEPTNLPEGTVINLVADDEGDDLTDTERRALHEALSAASQSVEAGRLRPASAILDELRQRR